MRGCSTWHPLVDLNSFLRMISATAGRRQSQRSGEQHAGCDVSNSVAGVAGADLSQDCALCALALRCGAGLGGISGGVLGARATTPRPRRFQHSCTARLCMDTVSQHGAVAPLKGRPMEQEDALGWGWGWEGDGGWHQGIGSGTEGADVKFGYRAQKTQTGRSGGLR